MAEWAAKSSTFCRWGSVPRTSERRNGKEGGVSRFPRSPHTRLRHPTMLRRFAGFSREKERRHVRKQSAADPSISSITAYCPTSGPRTSPDAPGARSSPEPNLFTGQKKNPRPSVHTERGPGICRNVSGNRAVLGRNGHAKQVFDLRVG